jgi:hypothetical protein
MTGTPGEPSRLDTAILVAGAVAVLAAGAWWWVATAPGPEVAAADSPTRRLEAMLPAEPNAARRESRTLADGAEIRWSLDEAARGYRVQLVCGGDGGVQVVVIGDTSERISGLDCSETVHTLGFDAAGLRWVVIRSQPPGSARVAAQLVAF